MTPYYEEKGIAIYHGDCRNLLRSLARVDLVIADPAYGETSLEWDQCVAGWTELLPSNNLWCFGSMRMFIKERDLFFGWRFAQDIVWRKHNGSNFHADRFRRVHEHAVQFYKDLSADGGPRLQRSVIDVRSCHGYAEHPTQKPVEIISPLIEYSCPENGIVLDPFMGSGTTLVAAKRSGRKGIGIEIEERYCEIAANRLRQSVLPLMAEPTLETQEAVA